MLRSWVAALLLGLLLAYSSLPAQNRSKAKLPAPGPPGTTTFTSFDQGHTVTGWLDVIPFTSKIFHNTRMLRVWVPGNYLSPANAHRRYPILYMQDGQNLFDKATSNGVEWQLDETLDHLIGSFKMEPVLVVGIDNAGEKRASEYLPYPDPHNTDLGPAEQQEVHGKEYARFVITEVMPFVEKYYRVAKGAANTGIGGASYGAVVSLSAALEHPGVFGEALIESPTLWVGGDQLLRDAERAKGLPQKMFLATGSAEQEDFKTAPPVVPPVLELEKILRKRGMGPNRLKVVVEEGAHHDTSAWAHRLPDALLFLYGR